MLIYGSGGHGLVVHEIALSLGETVSGFIDNNEALTTFNGLPVFHQLNDTHLIDEKIVMAIGNNQVRKRIASEINRPFTTLISPLAYVSPSSRIEEGSVIAPNAAIQARAAIGKHCIVNTGAVIEHECLIADFCHISSNATVMGGCTIGEGTFIDAGACIARNVTIGKNVTIGIGVIITDDVADDRVIR